MFIVFNDDIVVPAVFVAVHVVVVLVVLSVFVAPVFYIFVPGKIDR